MPQPDTMEMSKQLRANDGLFKVYYDFLGRDCEKRIVLAHKHYTQFGIKSLLRVLRHELAHHICYEDGKNMGHDIHFRDLCLELDGVLCENYAIGKYKNLQYRGIETPYK